MRTFVPGWTGPGFLARSAIVILTGLAWAASSLVAVVAQPAYWDPVTAADFFAVYAYSAAWLLTTASLLILREASQPARRLSVATLVVALACLSTGVANGAEDGLRLSGFGIVYVASFLVSVLGMFTLAAMFRASPARRFAFVPAVGGVSILLVTFGGGLLGVVAWLGFGFVLIRERAGPRAAPTTS